MGKPRGSNPVSSHDVAKAAGVSQSTVSRVLSGKQSKLVSQNTQEKILKIARELGYSPNPIAQALRSKKSFLLGLIVREIADPFFSKLIAQLSILARARGYHLVLGNAGSDPLQAIEINTYLDMRHTDGIFLLGDLHGDENLLFDYLQQNRVVVALCRGSAPSTIHTVNTDNHLGITILLDYLRSLNHQRIAFINGGWLGDIRERMEAYLEYIKLYEMPFHSDWVQTEVNTAEGGYRAADRLLQLEDLPTAVLASDDEMALGVIRRFSEAGLQMPQDVSVSGFDNIDIGRFTIPALTTVEQPIEEMCQNALDTIIKDIDESEIIDEPAIIRVKPRLVIRESIGEAPAKPPKVKL